MSKEPSQYLRIHGWMNYQDLYREVAEALPDGAHVVEVGVWQGRSLCYMVEMMRLLGKTFRVDGVDPFHSDFAPNAVYPRYLRRRLRRKFISGSWLDHAAANLRATGVLDSVRLIQLPSVMAAGAYPDGSLDFVWIDGDHRYDAVLADLRAWWPKVKPGGVLAGHDYDKPDVVRAVRDSGLGKAEPRSRSAFRLVKSAV